MVTSKNNFRVITVLQVAGLLLASIIAFDTILPNAVPGLVSIMSIINAYCGKDTDGNTKVILCIFVTIFAILYFIKYKSSTDRSMSKDLLHMALGLYVAMLIITVVKSANPEQSFEAIVILVTVTVGLIASTLCSHRQMFGIIVIASSLQAILALMDLRAGTHVLISGTVVRAGGLYDEPLVLCTVLLIALPLGIVIFAELKNSWTILLFSLCIAVMFAGLIATYERIGVMASLIGLAWLTYKLSKNRHIALGIACVMAAVCVGVLCVRDSGSSINEQSATRSQDSRYYYWTNGWNLFMRNPIQGAGVGDTPFSVENPPADDPNDFIFDPKSSALLWLDQFGIAGGLLYGLIAVTLYICLKQSSSTTAKGLAAALLGILILGITDCPFGTAATVVGNTLVAYLVGSVARLQMDRQTKV